MRDVACRAVLISAMSTREYVACCDLSSLDSTSAQRQPVRPYVVSIETTPHGAGINTPVCPLAPTITSSTTCLLFIASTTLAATPDDRCARTRTSYMMPLAFLKSVWTQYFPPAPTFTEKNVGDQTGKVFLITGANQGIGYELAKMLYPSGATIYLAGRSEEKTREAIRKIEEALPAPQTPATLKALVIDLADLTSVKRAAQEFTSKEDRLDVLWNNAGIGGAPLGFTTAQNIESHIGTNCVAPQLFTQLLLPQLRKATVDAPKGSVRVVWTGSAMVETHSVQGGIDWAAIESTKTTNSMIDYANSKVGNWFLSIEAEKAFEPYGIYSVVQNPGNLVTQAYRYIPKAAFQLLKALILYEPRYGAYTMAYSGLSGEVQNGEFIWPWGRKARSTRQDIHEAIEKGAAERFWKWCEERNRAYV